MLGVQAALAALLHPGVGVGQVERGLGQGPADQVEPGLAQGREVDADARRPCSVDLVRLEQLAGVDPQVVDRAPASRRWLSSVPSPRRTIQSPLRSRW